MTAQSPNRLVLPRRRVCGWLASGLAAHWASACGHRGPAERTTSLAVTIEADERINTNERDEPSPILLRLYELTAPSAFRQASFFDLLDNDTARLGTDLVAKREFELTPGETQTFARATPEATKHIGVMAGFREIGSARWRALADLPAQDESAFLIKIDATTVTLTLQRPPRTLGIF